MGLRKEGEMPKETIVTELTKPSDGEAVAVEVAWGRHQDVQLTTKLVDSDTRESKSLCVTDEHGEWDFEGGWYATLTRYEINELIRYLRRARDQAFGRDE